MIDIEVVLASVERHLEVVRAGWRSAWDAGESGPVVSGGSGDGVRSGRSAGSVVERAALGRVSDPVRRDLRRSVERLEGEAVSLASLVVRLAPPRSRNLADGSVVTSCGNPFGCPSDGRARRRGLCEGCWQFEAAHGRHRVRGDVEEQARRERSAAAERMRRRRAGDGD